MAWATLSKDVGITIQNFGVFLHYDGVIPQGKFLEDNFGKFSNFPK